MDEHDKVFVIAIAVLLATMFLYLVGKGIITVCGGGA